MKQQEVQQELPQMMTNAATAQAFNLSVSGLNKLRARDKQFPKPVRYGDGSAAIYFVRSEGAAYLAAKMAQRGEAA